MMLMTNFIKVSSLLAGLVTGPPNENIVQNDFNIALLNVF